MSANGAGQRIRLIFADEGSFHEVYTTLPAGKLEEYERLVDLLREDLEVTRELYVDMRRLVSASVVREDEER
jgi:hypothetical protein